MNIFYTYVLLLILFVVVQYNSADVIDKPSLKRRYRRFWPTLLSDVQKTEISAKDNGVIIVGGSHDAQRATSSTWLKEIKSGSSRLFGGATDFVLLPVDWVKHMLDNWVFYLCVIIIILGVVLYFQGPCRNQNQDQDRMNFGINLASMMMPFRSHR